MTQNSTLFLFDIDGTLIRGGTAVHREAFAHAYREMYGLPLDLDGIRAGGRTDTWLLAEPLRRFGLSDREIWSRMPAAFSFMVDFVERNLGDLRDMVLPGVLGVLEELKVRGRLLGLLTGNLSGIAWAKLHHAGLTHYFDTGGFGEESEIRADLVPVALRRAGERAGHEIPPSSAVIIGDTPLDVEAGKTRGTRTVAVATGPYSLDQLTHTQADLVIPSMVDVDSVIASLLEL